MSTQARRNPFRIGAFWQAALVIVAAYLIFDRAFPPLMPRSLMIQFMVVTVVGVLLYFSFEERRWAEFKAPILALLREDRLAPMRWSFLVGLPVLVAYLVYTQVKPSLEPPVELRQVHPAPPGSLKVFGKTYDLGKLENPKRLAVLERLKTDPDGAWQDYAQVVAEGRDHYYRNCYYCHGDLLDGTGPFAQAFNPLPINFQDVGTIAQLQEAFLFWRIATGGPGLPKEGTPWNSAMPVWHQYLDEDQVWSVITFLYDTVGQVPRMWDGEQSRTVTGMKDEILKRRAGLLGKDLYAFRCQVCHGEQGMGDGPAAERMLPRPRDFSLALFKYKTSPGTLPPRDEDLIATIRDGLPGTSMPGWGSLLTEAQIASLIPVIKGFDISSTWAPDGAPEEAFDAEGRYLKADFRSIAEEEPLAGQIPDSEESRAQGKVAFDKACKECHGEAGRGNITSGKKLADDWGFRLWPRDLTKPWTWRASEAVGADPRATRDETIRRIYTRLSIGIPGTPMPAHRAVEPGNPDPVSLEDRWHIANYVYGLRADTAPPTATGVIEALALDGGLPTTPDDPRWLEVPAATLHLAPNIIQGERLFTPLNDAVTVRVAYDEAEIAFLLTVDDRTRSLPGESYFTDLMDEALEMHPDALAIELPREGAFATAPVVTKPLYRHGDKEHPVTIWYWNAGSQEPALPARAALLDAAAPGAPPKPRVDAGDLKADAAWEDGRWRVLMRRARLPEDGDVRFEEGRFIPVAFANWDGNNGEVGSRHSLTTWYWLVLPPPMDPARTYGLPAGAGALAFLAGLGLVRSQRRRDPRRQDGGATPGTGT